ncbi:hypothetical protein L7F22_066896 [Adiantum nelumboides]|nr:hypothetical protein [Adiantum nelumboides]
MNYATVKSQTTILQVKTFNSIKKCAGVAVRHVESRKVHVHWKGVAEIILAESDKMLYPDKGALHISTEERNHLLNVIEATASASLCCIAFAFMEMDFDDVPSGELVEEWKLHTGSSMLLAIVGIKDPARPEVPNAVRVSLLA